MVFQLKADRDLLIDQMENPPMDSSFENELLAQESFKHLGQMIPLKPPAVLWQKNGNRRLPAF